MKKIALVLLLIFACEAYSQWEPLNEDLYGGSISELISMDSVVIAGTYSGVFRSIDSGKTWSATNLKGTSVVALLQAGNRIIAGGKDGLFISDDNGVTWAACEGFFQNVASLTGREDLLYMASSWGTYMSTDTGAVWNKIETVPSSQYINQLLVAGNFLFAARLQGLFRSSDRGVSWEEMDLGIGKNIPVREIAATTNKIFVQLGTILVISTDYGETWSSKNPRILSDDYTGIECLYTRGDEVFVSMKDGIFYSSDAGENWVKKSQNLPWVVNCITYAGEKILAGTYLGMSISADGGVTWEESNEGLTNINIDDIEINGEAMVLIKNDNLVCYSSDMGEHWNRPSNNQSYFSSVSYCGGKFYAGSSSAGVHVSEDNGVTWKSLNSGIDDLMIMVVQNSGDTLFAGGESLYRSTNGENWTKLNFSRGAVEILPYKDKVFLVTRMGGEIYATSDGGTNWYLKPDVFTLPGASVLSYLGDYLFAGTMDGFYISSNNGESWIRRVKGMNNNDISALETFDKTVIAGTYGGLYISTNNGVLWQNKTGDLPDSLITSLRINGPYIYAGVFGAGLYRAKLIDLGIKGIEDPRIANDLKIFPNPASDFINLEINDASFNNIDIQIFDMLGTEVLRISPKNPNRIKINVSTLSAGAYVLRFNGASASFIKY